MIRPDAHIMTQLQVSYVKAVAAIAGVTCDEVSTGNDYGTDVFLSDLMDDDEIGVSDTGVPCRCQLKSSITCKLRDNHVSYKLSVSAYNKLVHPRRGFIILIVFNLPREKSDWLKQSEDVLCLKHCCYWTRVTGEKSTNKNSITIKIPREQVFDSEAIKTVMRLANEDKNHG